jgi:hypothetical protein
MKIRFYIDKESGLPHISDMRCGKMRPNETKTMKQSKFPKGWDEERVKRVLDHYENQTEEEAVAEDEAAWSGKGARP